VATPPPAPAPGPGRAPREGGRRQSDSTAVTVTGTLPRVAFE
jgi:hypothetical protein